MGGHGGLGWLKGIKDFKDCFLWIQTSLVSLAAFSSRRSAPTWALHDETKTAAKETKTSLDIVYIAPKHLSVRMGDTHCEGEGGGGGGAPLVLTKFPIRLLSLQQTSGR